MRIRLLRVCCEYCNRLKILIPNRSIIAIKKMRIRLLGLPKRKNKRKDKKEGGRMGGFLNPKQPARFPDCFNYSQCLTVKAIEDKMLDCCGCDKYNPVPWDFEIENPNDTYEVHGVVNHFETVRS